MNTPKKYIILISTLSLVLTIAGCTESLKSSKNKKSANIKKQSDLQSEKNAKKYIDSGTNSETIVESAIELSEKYSKLLEEATNLKIQNKQLSQQNDQYKQKTEKLQAELDKTRQELQQANDLLIEMKLELNNWKADILGFRDEMKQAQQAQIEALYKILTILGAQPQTQPDTADQPTERQDK